MIGVGTAVETGEVAQGGKPGIAAHAHHPYALGHERPVQAGQRHHVADRPEGDQVEKDAQIRLRTGREPAAPAEFAVERHDHEERSEEHTSELQSLMRISSAVFCLTKKQDLNTMLTD